MPGNPVATSWCTLAGAITASLHASPRRHGNKCRQKPGSGDPVGTQPATSNRRLPRRCSMQALFMTPARRLRSLDSTAFHILSETPHAELPRKHFAGVLVVYSMTDDQVTNALRRQTETAYPADSPPGQTVAFAHASILEKHHETPMLVFVFARQQFLQRNGPRHPFKHEVDAEHGVVSGHILEFGRMHCFG